MKKTAEAVLIQGGAYVPEDEYPYSTPAAVVLEDGSFFVAAMIRQPRLSDDGDRPSVVRMWHLSTSLQVKGVADIDGSWDEDTYPRLALYGASVGGSRVAMLSQTWRDPGAVIWIIDCTGGAPDLLSTHDLPNTNYSYDAWAPHNVYAGNYTHHIYHKATDRLIVLACGYGPAQAQMSGGYAPTVQVFRGQTGELLSSMDMHVPSFAEAGYEGANLNEIFVGGAHSLHMDPNDPTAFKVTFDAVYISTIF